MANDPTPTKLTAAVDLPVESVLVTASSGALELAKSLLIDSDVMFGEADIMLKQAKRAFNGLEEKRTSMKEPFLKGCRNIDEFFNRLKAPWGAIEVELKHKMLAYSQEQDRKRQEEQRKAEELRRQEQARVEREAREREQEAARVAQEQRAAAAALAQQAEQAAAAGKIEEAVSLADQAHATVQQADVTEEIGRAEGDIMRDTAAMMPAAPPTTEAPRMTGTSIARPWVGEIHDKRALLLHLTAPENIDKFIDWIEIRQSNVNSYVKSLKDKAVMPGLTVKQEARLSART